MGSGELALTGLRVIDCATLFAGPLVGTLLGDFGADVIKVEQPEGEGMRTMGTTASGESTWWALVSRNKRAVTLRLSTPEGADVFRKLIADVDVLIENFRPGTLERWGLAPESLLELNPDLVILRVTGFGQDGPYSQLPGYGTLAEAMSGFAQVNGWPDGPPTLPPLALGDSVAALAGCCATMFALHWRDHGGRGQVIDLSILEPLFWVLGPQASLYQQNGTVPGRQGNRIEHTALRNAFRTKDDRWVVTSATTQNVAERLMGVIGRPELAEEEWFASHHGRLEHADELDALLAEFIAARTLDEVREAFAEGQAATAPIFTIADIMADPHYAARGTIVEVDHPTLGPLAMQNMIARLLATPGRVKHPGPTLGEHNDEVYGELGFDPERRARLREQNVI